MTALTNTCPACGAPPLIDCNAVVDGVQTGWDHDDRILEPIIHDIKATQDGGVVICEAPATGTTTVGGDRPYPACDEHAVKEETA